MVIKKSYKQRGGEKQRVGRGTEPPKGGSNAWILNAYSAVFSTTFEANWRRPGGVAGHSGASVSLLTQFLCRQMSEQLDPLGVDFLGAGAGLCGVLTLVVL
jgi:hypothetical protein